MSQVPAKGPMRSGARLQLKPGSSTLPNATTANVVAAKDKDRSYRLAFGSLLVSIVVAVASPLSAWVIAKFHSPSAPANTTKH